MTEASKKRPRDDIPCVPIGSPVWIVKSWREVAKVPWNNDGISEYCVHGVFATLKAANAEARRARDNNDHYRYQVEEGYVGQEEEEGTEEEEEEEGTDEEAKKANDEEPFVYYLHLGYFEADEGSLNVVVEKFDLR